MGITKYGDPVPEPILRMTGIIKEFSGVRVLHGVDFEIRSGEVMALMGENGAGKSTLMKVLAGVYADWEGSIVIGSGEVRPTSTTAAEKAGISIIYQELSLIPELTVAENICLGREPLRFGGVIDYSRMNEMARSLLDDLHFPAPPTVRVSSLTIGHQQLVEIAKALSMNARILIMDEPTSALTEQETAVLFSVVGKLRERGVSIIYISHRIGEVFDIADRVTVMRDGHIVGVREIGEVSRDDLIRLMVGRDIDAFFVPKRKPEDDIALRVRGLSRTGGGRGRKPPVRDVSFEVRRGENVGIAGLLGAGRTELLEALFGADSANTRGTIELEGTERRFRTPLEAIESGIALITEDRKSNGLILGMNVLHNMTLAALNHIVRGGILSPALEHRLCERYVKDLGITASSVENPVESLSGGNQQKVMLAKWLATNPRVLLLDEPTRGIDVGAKHAIYQLLSELARRGMAIVMTSSELPELLALCDRIMVMREGEVSAVFSRDEATQEKILDAASPLA